MKKSRNRVLLFAGLAAIAGCSMRNLSPSGESATPIKLINDAQEVIRWSLVQGRCTAIDAELEGYFDSIPHDNLIACARRRAVEEVCSDRSSRGSTPQSRNGMETAKSNADATHGEHRKRVLSLLANIHLHWFDVF